MEQNIVLHIIEQKEKNIELRGKMFTHDVNLSVMVSFIRLSSCWISYINLNSLINVKKTLPVILLSGSSL